MLTFIPPSPGILPHYILSSLFTVLFLFLFLFLHQFLCPVSLSAFTCFLFLHAMAFSTSCLFYNLSSMLSPSAPSHHFHSSTLFTFHLSVLTRLSAVLSSRCRGDAFTSPIVIESYEYFSPIVQLSTTSSPVIYLSASHHIPLHSLLFSP